MAGPTHSCPSLGVTRGSVGPAISGVIGVKGVREKLLGRANLKAHRLRNGNRLLNVPHENSLILPNYEMQRLLEAYGDTVRAWRDPRGWSRTDFAARLSMTRQNLFISSRGETTQLTLLLRLASLLGHASSASPSPPSRWSPLRLLCLSGNPCCPRGPPGSDHLWLSSLSICSGSISARI